MSDKPWSREEDELRERLLHSGYNYSVVASLMNEHLGDRIYTSKSVKSRTIRYRRQTAALCNSAGITFDAAWELMNELIGRQEVYIKNKVSPSNNVILNIQDLHVPFHDESALLSVVEENKTKASTCIVSADFLDLYSLSRFTNYKSISIRDEIKDAVKVAQYLSRSFDRVIFLKGNHEERAYKYFAKRVPQELMFLIQHDILALVTKGMDNVEVVDNWWYQVGDFITGHPEIASTVPMKPVLKSLDWFLSWQRRLGIKPFRVLQHAHTHKCGVYYKEYGGVIYKLIEGGCLCDTQEYATKTGGKYAPITLGYVLVYQDENGVTDFDLTREYVLL